MFVSVTCGSKRGLVLRGAILNTRYDIRYPKKPTRYIFTYFYNIWSYLLLYGPPYNSTKKYPTSIWSASETIVALSYTLREKKRGNSRYALLRLFLVVIGLMLLLLLLLFAACCCPLLLLMLAAAAAAGRLNPF